MLFAFPAASAAEPPKLDPSGLDWLAGIWESTEPEAMDTPLMPNQVGQIQGRTHSPMMVVEEIWFQPDETFLQVWQGTGGEPVRLHLASVSESSVIFEGGASTFPARVEYVKTADGVRVDRSGTLQGEPFTMNWTYIPRRATPPWAEKGPDTP